MMVTFGLADFLGCDMQHPPVYDEKSIPEERLPQLGGEHFVEGTDLGEETAIYRTSPAPESLIWGEQLFLYPAENPNPKGRLSGHSVLCGSAADTPTRQRTLLHQALATTGGAGEKKPQ